MVSVDIRVFDWRNYTWQTFLFVSELDDGDIFWFRSVCVISIMTFWTTDFKESVIDSLTSEANKERVPLYLLFNSLIFFKNENHPNPLVLAYENVTPRFTVICNVFEWYLIIPDWENVRISHSLIAISRTCTRLSFFEEIFSSTTFYYQPREKLKTVRVTVEPTSLKFLTDLNRDVHVMIIYR